MSIPGIFATLLLIAVAATAILYVARPAMLFDWLIAITRRLARVRWKTIEVDGITWPYLEGGPPDGEVLLLVHGFGAEKDHWLAYARQFSKTYRVVIPDVPGFGEATKSADLDFGMAAQAERLDGFLQALGISRCHAAGNSMGGYIVLKLALDNPARLESLTLLNNAGVSGSGRTELEEAVARGESPLVMRSPADVDRLLAFTMVKPPHIPARFKQVVFDQNGPHADFRDDVFAVLSRDHVQNPLNSRLPEVRVPTLVIWGRHDRLIDVSCVEVLQAGVPDCESYVFEDLGHMPMVEAPVRTARRHIAFLDRE